MITNSPPKPHYTAREVARELGLAQSTIYTMMDRGKVKYIILRRTQKGLNRVIPHEELERLRPLYQIEQETHDEENTTR